MTVTTPRYIYDLATDADCDGVLIADDCDDTDISLGAIVDDPDCDGVQIKEQNPTAVNFCNSRNLENNLGVSRGKSPHSLF